MHSSLAGSVLTTLTLYSLIPSVSAQTYSSCNPLQQSGCPADPALSKTVDIDFTAGSSNDFTASGAVSYTSDGAAFTISQHGDAPTISSNWYIMFGHVDYVVKAAPGTGIVSAAILQSDCLDEIDWEWIGGDDTQAQSNYFGKGITTTGYNRGEFHGAPNNHDEFHTYSIDWTADQIVWSIDGTTVRAMTQDQAEAGQYPQTPMYLKLGAWAGGDPSNPEGTIQWAGGVTDYSAGPFTMYVKSVHVTDYSTGSQYSYSGTSGTWQSIVSTGGQINGQGDGTPASSGSAPTVTSSVPNSAPLAFGNSGDTSSVYATRTGWPWSGTATATAVSVSTSLFLYTSSSVVLSSASASASLEISTSYNEQGFPTLVTINPAAPTTPVSYDSQGFPITSTNSISESTSQPATAQGSPVTAVTGSASVSSASAVSSTSGSGPSESPSSAASAPQSPSATAAGAPETTSTNTLLTAVSISTPLSSISTLGVGSVSTSVSATATTTISAETESINTSATSSPSSTSSIAFISTTTSSTGTESITTAAATSPSRTSSSSAVISLVNSQSQTTISNTGTVVRTTLASSTIVTSIASSAPISSSVSSTGSSSSTNRLSPSSSKTSSTISSRSSASENRSGTSAVSSHHGTTLTTSSQGLSTTATISASATASGTPPAVNIAAQIRILHPFGGVVVIGALCLF